MNFNLTGVLQHTLGNLKYETVVSTAMQALFSRQLSVRLGPVVLTAKMSDGSPVHLSAGMILTAGEHILADLAAGKSLSTETFTIQSGNLQLIVSPYTG